MTDISDVVYVEDNSRDWGKPFSNLAKDNGITSYRIQTFIQLETALNDCVRGELYVLNEKFPYGVPGGRKERLAGNAISLIRKLDSSDANIIIVSSDPHTASLARELGVGYIDKNEGLGKMFSYVKDLFEQIKSN